MRRSTHEKLELLSCTGKERMRLCRSIEEQIGRGRLARPSLPSILVPDVPVSVVSTCECVSRSHAHPFDTSVAELSTTQRSSFSQATKEKHGRRNTFNRSFLLFFLFLGQ